MFKKIIAEALLEDFAFDDITSDLTIPQNRLVAFEINSREQIIFCGKPLIEEVFLQLKKNPKLLNTQY